MSDLREQIRKAIMKGIDEDNRANPEGITTMKDVLDPDTCGRCADEVIAVLVTELTQQRFVAKFHPTMIYPATIIPVD